MKNSSNMEVVAIVAEEFLRRKRKREQTSLQLFDARINEKMIESIKEKLYGGQD